MKSHICILLNSLDEYDFEGVLRRYLPVDKFKIDLAETFPDNPDQFQLIVPWSYRKIIKDAGQFGNIVVLHSSNLPEGRGWAPIYHAFSEEKQEYVISAIYAADKVDAGKVIMRARFPMQSDYTASFIRNVDEELSLLMLYKILQKWPDGKFSSTHQMGDGTYRARRSLKDNEVDLDKSLKMLLPHLRGVESNSPAFFFYNDVKYLVEIRPERSPIKPKKVLLEYPALNETEIWTGWK